MKTVQYEGKSFEVPDWAKYIVADDDGDVYVYSSKPRKCESGYWYDSETCISVGWMHIPEFPLEEIK